MNLVDEADLLALMEEEDADAYTAEKEAAAQAEQDRLKAEEEAKKSRRRSGGIRHGTAQGKQGHKDRIRLSGRGGADCAGGQAAASMLSQSRNRKSRQKKKPLTPMQTTPRTRGDFEIPTDVPDEDETPDEQDTEPI